MGAALDPDVGLVTILESVGIPAAGIALVIGVDRVLDMGRTVANVAGDLIAALVIGARTREAPEAAVFDPMEG